MIEPGVADPAGIPEVELRARDILGGPRWHAAGVGRQPVPGGQLELAVIYERRADGDVRMRPCAVWRGPGAHVPRGDGDSQARCGAKPVGDRQRQAERVPGPTVQKLSERHLVASRPVGEIPVGPAREAVDGVSAGGLAQVKLEAAAIELAPAAVDPVRPRREQLPGAARRKLIRFVPGDQRTATETQPAQAGAELGDGCLVITGADVMLRSGQRYWPDGRRAAR